MNPPGLKRPGGSLLYCLSIQYLEAVVKTEDDVAAVNVNAPSVFLHLGVVVLLVLIADETYVGDKTQMVAKIDCYTGFQTN